jgi:predicted transcriptional regulator
MVDLRFDVPETEEVDVDEETLAAIDRGIGAADTGRYLTVEEVRELVPKWLSGFASRKRQ